MIPVLQSGNYSQIPVYIGYTQKYMMFRMTSERLYRIPDIGEVRIPSPVAIQVPMRTRIRKQFLLYARL
jgi:hypothetical protein